MVSFVIEADFHMLLSFPDAGHARHAVLLKQQRHHCWQGNMCCTPRRLMWDGMAVKVYQ